MSLKKHGVIVDCEHCKYASTNGCGEYLDKWAKPHKRTWQEDKRILEKDVIPAWGRRKAKNITRRDVIRLIDGIVDRGSPIVANRTLEIIRKMFNFAVEQDIIETSPCVGVRAPGKETQRDRILTESEIRNFWNVLDRENKDDEPEGSKLRMALGTRLALKLQLLTPPHPEMSGVATTKDKTKSRINNMLSIELRLYISSDSYGEGLGR